MSKDISVKDSGNGGNLDISRLMKLLAVNIRGFCGIVLATALIAVIISYTLPKRYQAMSTVSVEQNVVSDLVKGIAVTPSVDTKLRLLNVYLLSRNVLLKVASTLDMDLEHTTPAGQEELIRKLRGRVTISRDEKKGLFYIAYTDSNPVLARDFVNTMTRVYIEESTAAKRQESSAATTFLAEQIEVFQKRIEQAQVDIDNFKAQKGMYLGLNEQLLRQQIKDQEQRLDGMRIRKNELVTKMNLLLEESPAKVLIREKEAELKTLLASYTNQHPAVIRARKDIALLRASDSSSEIKSNPEYQSIVVELESLEALEKNLQATLDGNVRDLQELPSIRTQLAELEQRKQNETHIYEQLVARFGQSEVSKQMELQDKSVTFKVIDAAVEPTIHTFPKRHLFMLGGVFLGFALGFCWLLLNDLLRGKITSAKDLQRFGVSVLAKLPRLSPPDHLKQEKRRNAVLAGTALALLMVCSLALLEFLQVPHVEKAISYVAKLFS